jgi:hypothetical protein
MNKNILSLILTGCVLGSVFFLAGCGQKKPAGFPNVVPCTVSIVKDGKPLDNTMVILSAVSNGGNWITSGRTNSAGVAVMSTNSSGYAAEGSPEREYKVILSRPIVIEQKYTEQELFEMSEEKKQAYQREVTEKEAKARVIPEIYESAATTPIKITVSKGETVHTIELNDYK